MLVPREKPYIHRLNSFYLDVSRFVEHLQGEIGSGCIHFRSSGSEILIYFDERDILRVVYQENGRKAVFSANLETALAPLLQRTYIVTVYYLDPNAIFFWGQLPHFVRAKEEQRSDAVSLPDLIHHLEKKRFSGFVDVRIRTDIRNGILFFKNGSRLGGSYYWGKGGLTASEKEYQRLLAMVQAKGAYFSVGYFIQERSAKQDVDKSCDEEETRDTDPRCIAGLTGALEEFLLLYASLFGRRRNRSAPVIHLKRRFLERIDVYPFLDPFASQFEYLDGKVRFSSDAPRVKIANAVISCVWEIVAQHNLEKKFRKLLSTWPGRKRLEALGIMVLRH